MLDVSEFVAGVLDLDVRWTDAGNPRAANLPFAQRIEQDRKPCEVKRVLRFDAFQRDLIFKLAQMLAGRNDGRVDSQHVKPQPVVTAVVADLDDVALAELVERLGKLVVFLSLVLADRVEKGVPDFRRNIERLAGLRFLKAIGHPLHPDSKASETPVLVDPLDVGGDRFLD